MSNDKKDIFESMKDKFENNEFEFNPDHWDQMEDLLDKKEKEPRKKFLFRTLMFLSALFFVVIAGISLWLNIDDKKAEKLSQNTTEKTVSQEQIANNNLKKKKKKTTQINQNKDDNTKIKSEVSDDTGYKELSDTDVTNENSKNNVTPENQDQQEKNTVINKAKEELNQKSVISLTTDRASKTNNNKEKKSDVIVETLESKENYADENKVDEQNETNNTSIAANAKPDIGITNLDVSAHDMDQDKNNDNNSTKGEGESQETTTTTDKNKPVTGSNSGPKKSDIISNSDKESIIVDNSNNISDQKNIFSEDNEMNKMTSLTNVSKRLPFGEGRQAVMLPTLLSRQLITDSLSEPLDSAIAIDSVNDENDSTKKLPFKLFVATGVNYYRGFLNTGIEREKNSLNGIFGLGINKNISRKTGVILSVNYYQKSNLNSSKEFESIYYDFGVRNKITRIEQEKLYWVSGEIGGYYQVSTKISLFGTMEFSKLLNSKSSISILTKQALSSEFVAGPKTNEMGYYNGFSNNAMNVNFGMRYTLAPKLELSARYSYGLTDITDNTYFQNNSKDMNSGIRFLLNYNLINR